MLAEDDENLGYLLKEYLQAKEYDVDLYKDGEKAYKGFQNNYYDICILDVMMPLKDGFTLAKEIRMVNPSMPILFLTAKSMKEDVIEGFAIGADDYMTKPFSIEELLMRLEAILRRTRKDANGASKPFSRLASTFSMPPSKPLPTRMMYVNLLPRKANYSSIFA